MVLPICAANVDDEIADPQRYYTQGVVYDAPSGLKLRSTPEMLDDDSNADYLLPNGQNVRIIQQVYSDDGISWYYIMTYWAGGNRYGYVAARYVKIVSGS